MTDVPPPLHPQSQMAMGLVNRNKIFEEQCLRIIDELRNLPSVDQRWVSVAKTNLEQGFMALNRSIFQPHRVDLWFKGVTPTFEEVQAMEAESQKAPIE